MTEVEHLLRKLHAEARGAVKGGEPHADESYDETNEYWYQRGMEDCSEMCISALLKDHKRDDNIKVFALGILEELEVIT
jgi:hypothetical protein